MCENENLNDLEIVEINETSCACQNHKKLRVKDFAKHPSSALQYALDEFKYVGWMDKDYNFPEPDEDEMKSFGRSMQEVICVDILRMLNIISEGGHTGFSANYLIDVFTRLAKFKPLGTIHDVEEEWNKINDNTYHHKRCGHVFKDWKGRAKDIVGRLFRSKDSDPDSLFTNKDSEIDITFPYMVPDKPPIVDEQLTPDTE